MVWLGSGAISGPISEAGGMEIKKMATPIGARDWLVLERSLEELGVSL